MTWFSHTPHSLILFLLLMFALTSASVAQHRANIDKAGTFVVTSTDQGLILENVRTGEKTALKSLQVTMAPPPPATSYTFHPLPAPRGANGSYAFGISSNGKNFVGGYAAPS